MDSFKKGWFTEVSPLWDGQCMSIEVLETLEDFKSDYQHVQVFKTKTYGMMLVLDGVIQLTDRDEFAYQEMMAHLPLCSHPCPKKVCVIGGGDGGVVTEVLKHNTVTEVVWCEIDQAVMDMGRKFFPKFANAFSDSRVQVHQGDGAAFLREHKGAFDAVIVDSSDPIGPAATLFEESFFATMHASLAEGGVAATQAECLWLHLDIIKGIVAATRRLFASAEYGFLTIPTYPSGQIGVLLSSNVKRDLKQPLRTGADAMSAEAWDNLQYYDDDVHVGAFALPKFVKKALAGL
mmetsp:Transcript_15079/g.59055  ORF Transcript_15079/g.59055 Transcript_15079/m.59055 type:complete len:291 (+) Transcript_15079:501-1373(+)